MDINLSYVDEDILTSAERREALFESVSDRGDCADSEQTWASQLTLREQEELETARNVKLPFVIYQGESPVLREKLGELAVAGTLRRFARLKYSDGHAIAYGDSINLRSPARLIRVAQHRSATNCRSRAHPRLTLPH